MKKSLNLLVALALVFSLLTPAMAFAATSQESAAGAKLQQYGVLSGGTDGDLMLDADLKREDMIVLLSRLLNAEEEAKAHENNHGFTDVDNPFYDSYISWAKAEGLTQGIGNDRFGQNTNLKLKDLLQFQLRVLGYADVAYDDVPAKAEELGLIEEGLDAEAPVTRGQMALVTLNALNTEVNGEGILLGAKLEIDEFIPDVGILAFAATGAKKLEVKMASAVDTEEAKVTVKRGTVTVNTSDVKWSSDKKTATIETSSRLVEGTYTVSVEGVADEALTASVDVQNEKVESIEILNDVAPMDRNSNGDDIRSKVVVNYAVKNQYGENVSNIYVPNATASGNVEEVASGTIKVSKSNGEYVINETVFVSLVYIGQNYTVSAQKNLTVGLSAKADTVEVTDVYNEDAEAVLSSDVSDDEAGNFKLLLDVKDQYGNDIKDLDILENDLIVTVGGTHILEVAYENDVPAFEIVEIDGENVVALPLAKVKTNGSAVVNVVPKYSGKSANYTVVVGEGLVYDQVILTPVSSVVAAGEDVLVPVTVLDTKGNTITDAKKLNDALVEQNGIGVDKIRISLSGPATGLPQFVTKDGNLYIEFKAANQGTITVSSITESYKSHYLNIDVKAKATPRVVVGLKSDLNKLIFQGDDVELKKGNIHVEDNYGRIMSESALDTAFADGYRIAIEAVDPTEEITVQSDVYVDASNEKIVLEAKAVSGTTAIKFHLQKEGLDENNNTVFNKVSGSEWNTSFRAVTLGEISKIEVNNVDTLYAGANAGSDLSPYAKEVKVTGTTKDGKKVSISSGNFTVTSLTQKVAATGNKVQVTDPSILSKDNTELTAKVRAVLSNGLSAEKDVTVSNVAPKVDSVKIKKVASVEIDNNEVTLTGAQTLNFASLTDELEIKDQYGVKAPGTTSFADTTVALPDVSVTFSDLPDGKTAAQNGTDNATYNAAVGEEFTVTLKIGSASASVKVKVN